MYNKTNIIYIYIFYLQLNEKRKMYFCNMK